MKKHYASSFLCGASLKPATERTAGLRRRIGFTLTEVVLAVGVLSLAIVALVGLFGPTMGAVKQVVDRTGALAVADHINSQLLSNEIYDVYNLRSNADPFFALSEKLTADDGYVFSWKEYATAGSTRGDTTALSLQLASNDDRPTSGRLPRIEGPVYIAILEEGLQGSTNEFDFDNVSTSAYFPIKVSIYEAPMDLIISGGAIVRQDYIEGKRGTPLFQYTTAKLR